jgi:hypothetical protein
VVKTDYYSIFHQKVMLLPDITIDSSEEDIVAFCKDEASQAPGYGHEMKLNYGLNLLLIKQQKQLVEDQNEYNKKILNANKKLVYATFGLVIATLLAGALQTYFLEKQVSDTRDIESSGLMFSLAKDFRTGVSSDLIYAIATNETPLLTENKGKFTDEQLDNYLVGYELLDQAYSQGLITKDMLSVAFSYDIERAYQNNEVTSFIHEARQDNRDDSIYQGFESLAQLFKQ